MLQWTTAVTHCKCVWVTRRKHLYWKKRTFHFTRRQSGSLVMSDASSLMHSESARTSSSNIHKIPHVTLKLLSLTNNDFFYCMNFGFTAFESLNLYVFIVLPRAYKITLCLHMSPLIFAFSVRSLSHLCVSPPLKIFSYVPCHIKGKNAISYPQNFLLFMSFRVITVVRKYLLSFPPLLQLSTKPKICVIVGKV